MSYKHILDAIPFVLCMLVACYFFPSAYAIIPVNMTLAKYNILAVEYSQACLTMIQNHAKTDCPTLDKLVKYDTSNQFYSGKFIDKNTTRTNPTVKNHYMIYQYYKNMVVCVVCKVPLGNPDVFKTLFIEPSNFIFIPDKSKVVTDNTFVTSSGRYVSPNCMTSTVAYNDTLISDTISYMLSGCTKTNFNGNVTNHVKDTPFEMHSPYSSMKHYNWLPLAKKNNMGDCITKKCATPADPYKKIKWG